MRTSWFSIATLTSALYYSKDEQGLARVSPRKLLEASLRMRPDRILLAELRAAEAYDYLRNVNSGHPGSVTSVHAASAELAFEQLVLLVKQSDGGRGLSRMDIRSLLYLLVDVVIQCGVECHRRFISEIWYARNVVCAGSSWRRAQRRRLARMHDWLASDARRPWARLCLQPGSDTDVPGARPWQGHPR